MKNKIGSLENPIKLNLKKYAESFFGTKKDHANSLFEMLIGKVFEREFNEDGTHNYYDTVQVYSDKTIHLFLDDVWCLSQDFDKIRKRFSVLVTYDNKNKNIIKITCSANDKEDNAIYAEVIY